MKKLINYLLLVTVSFLVLGTKVSAGTLNVYASSSSVTVGTSIVVTVKAPDVAGRFSVTSSNGSVLSGGSSSTWIEGTVTFTFRANNPGTATITVTPIDAGDYGGKVFTTSRSVKVTVNPKKVVVLSTDNTLSGLGIDGVTLDPEFNKDTLEYTVQLEPETTKVNINAVASNGGATISGAGEREVTDGDNNLEIVVTAENGTTRTYVIKAIVKEYNPITVKINNKDYTVVRKKTSLTPPSNYVEKTVTINNEEIPAYYSEITKYTIVSLKDEKGNQNWYIYNKDKYTLYKEHTFGKTILYIIDDKEKIPSEYTKTTIKYNDELIPSYKINNSSKYALIYAINVETGRENLYMYDEVESTVQIYNDEVINKVKDESNMYLKILIGVSSALVLSIGISIFILIKNKKKPQK